MPRSASEWIGRTDDQAVPPRVRLRIWRKQCGEANFAICPLSGIPMRDTDEKHLDHAKALIEGGEHRESNLRFVLAAAHREKTAAEVERRAKNDAVARRHSGVVVPHRTALSGRTREQKRADRDAKAAGRMPLPPRRLLRGFESATDAGER